MAGIFDEGRMMQVLEGCVPEGETVTAGVHGVTLQINQKKTSVFDVYVGLTGSSLLVAECEERQYLNGFYRVPDLRKAVTEDLGTCIPLAQIEKCEIKKGIMGAANCSITLRDGSFLKLQLPKRGGLGEGMPHHGEYRERIIERLSSLHG
ncbi:MAG: hypothetical protein HFF26_00230 [Oscillospiraceae bacterium]|nr:hypothetical protein [Oscillospiraceae bacterium]